VRISFSLGSALDMGHFLMYGFGDLLDGVMARPLRIQYKGAFYHITARGNERKRIFFSNSDYDKFKDYLRKAQDK